MTVVVVSNGWEGLLFDDGVIKCRTRTLIHCRTVTFLGVPVAILELVEVEGRDVFIMAKLSLHDGRGTCKWLDWRELPRRIGEGAR